MPSEYHQRLAKIKTHHPRAYERWSWDDEVLLTELLNANQSIDAMAQALGRQPSAVRSRIAKRQRGDYIFEYTPEVPDSITQTHDSGKEKMTKPAGKQATLYIQLSTIGSSSQPRSRIRFAPRKPL